MRGIISTAVLVIINFVLQTTLMQNIQIRGVLPNTALIIIISFALLKGSKNGAIVGFFSGLVYDVLFGSSIGFYALLYMLAGYFCGKFNENFYRENYFLPTLLSACSVVVFESIIYFTHVFMSGNFMYFYFVFNKFLPEAVYTVVFVVPVYRIVFAINEQLEARERRSRRLF